MSRCITTVTERVEDYAHQWVINRPAGIIRLQIALSYVGFVLGIMYEDPIPRLVFRRSAARHLLVPVFGSLKMRISIHNYTPIIK